MKVFNTINELFEASESQLKIENVVNERLYTSNGWEDIKISDELKKEIFEEVSNVLGGRDNTKNLVKFALEYRKPQHWGLSRLIIEKYGDTQPRVVYIAGQDYTSERAEIRNYIKKLY